VLNAATRMRLVGRAGVGIDNIDVTEATKQGIMVMNTPNGNTVSTAQLAMSLMCSMARKVPAANISIKEGKWDRKLFSGVEINGKTIGIVGCGRIGQVVAQCATSMGMTVLGYDPVTSTEVLAGFGIQKVELDEIFEVIILYSPKMGYTVTIYFLTNREVILLHSIRLLRLKPKISSTTKQLVSVRMVFI